MATIGGFEVLVLQRGRLAEGLPAGAHGYVYNRMKIESRFGQNRCKSRIGSGVREGSGFQSVLSCIVTPHDPNVFELHLYVMSFTATALFAIHDCKPQIELVSGVAFLVSECRKFQFPNASSRCSAASENLSCFDRF